MSLGCELQLLAAQLLASRPKLGCCDSAGKLITGELLPELERLRVVPAADAAAVVRAVSVHSCCADHVIVGLLPASQEQIGVGSQEVCTPEYGVAEREHVSAQLFGRSTSHSITNSTAERIEAACFHCSSCRLTSFRTSSRTSSHTLVNFVEADLPA
ncbi:hypothetical protein COO60DRAFT_1458452 [Scenedesmus sp. NREL 46B-D3]|nr:hypothetical protein COO60DRAFT_1458452 [Scenedesmus sp. NREL 46B-D3]